MQSLVFPATCKILLAMTTANTFGKWLEAQRKTANLTQGELARRVGCTRAYISSLEREVVESKSGRPIQPSLEIVDSIARSIGIPLPIARKAAGYYSPADDASEEEKQMLAYYQDLSPEGKSIAAALIQALHSREIELENKQLEELGLRRNEILFDVSIVGKG